MNRGIRIFAACAAGVLIIPVLATAEGGSGCPQFTKNFSRGSRGADVVMLQRYFAKLGLLSSDSATGYYGVLTEQAVRTWQSNQGLVSSGSAFTTGYGAMGPRTRTALRSWCMDSTHRDLETNIGTTATSTASVPKTDTLTLTLPGRDVVTLTGLTERNAAATCRLTGITNPSYCNWGGAYPDMTGVMSLPQLTAEKERANGTIAAVLGAPRTYEFTDPTLQTQNYMFLAMELELSSRGYGGLPQKIRRVVPMSVSRDGHAVHVTWSGDVMDNGVVTKLSPSAYVLMAINLDSSSGGIGPMVQFSAITQ
jgi:hypothetical protein